MAGNPIIREVMTASPKTISIDDSVEQASQTMVEYDCRHLPVMDGEKLVGVISDRDISLALSFLGKDPSDLLVRSVFVEHPYTAQSSDTLLKVLNDMVTLHIGSVLVSMYWVVLM